MSKKGNKNNFNGNLLFPLVMPTVKFVQMCVITFFFAIGVKDSLGNRYNVSVLITSHY